MDVSPFTSPRTPRPTKLLGRSPLAALALRLKVKDVICGSIVAGRAVPRAPSGRCRTAADYAGPAMCTEKPAVHR